jgi:hypothetical protein
MINSNPETVSTDYDTSDKLFFEPLTLEDVLHIYEREKCWGAIAQFGGQTPLNLALGLQKNGVNIIGTSPQSIEIAEDRKLFAAMLDKLQIPQPPNGIATNEAEALAVAKKLDYPVLVRPSFVLGGRAMQIVYSDAELQHYMRFALCSWINSSKTRRKWTRIASRTWAISNIPAKARSSSAVCWNTSSSPACIPVMRRWFCRRTRFQRESSKPSVTTRTRWRES